MTSSCSKWMGIRQPWRINAFQRNRVSVPSHTFATASITFTIPWSLAPASITFTFPGLHNHLHLFPTLFILLTSLSDLISLRTKPEDYNSRPVNSYDSASPRSHRSLQCQTGDFQSLSSATSRSCFVFGAISRPCAQYFRAALRPHKILRLFST